MTRHRILYPTQTPSNNNGTECSDCGVPYTEFYYISPPPPPLPPLPPPSTFYGDDGGDKSNGVSPPIIVLFALLSSLLLLLLYYIVVAKSCFGLCKRRRRNYEGDPLAGSESDGGDQQAGGENRSAVDHPIWFITTVGLQQSIINSITVLKYRKSEGLIEGTDCSVCLTEFREGETVRLLPKCSHAFHVTCIDTWLRSHTNCPLCRANIVSNNNNNEQSLVSRANSRGTLDISAVQNDNNNSNDDRVEEIVSNDENGVRRREENDVVRLTVVRRWVSMDDNDLGGQKREDKFARMIRLSPVAMKKRSLSCGGLRFLSSRYSNNNSYQLRIINSILPL